MDVCLAVIVQLMEEDVKGDIFLIDEPFGVPPAATVSRFVKNVMTEAKLKGGPQLLRLYAKKPSKEDKARSLGPLQPVPKGKRVYVLQKYGKPRKVPPAYDGLPV